MFYMTVAKLCCSLHHQSCATQGQGTSVRKYESIVAYYSFYVENSRGNNSLKGIALSQKEVLHHSRLQRSNSLCRSWTAGSDAHNKSTVGKHHDTSYYRHMRHSYVTEGQCVCDCFVIINPLMSSLSNYTEAPEYSAECFLCSNAVWLEGCILMLKDIL